MKLKVLVDNNTYIDEYYLGEPAASYYVEHKDSKILFDTGYSDVLIKNAEKMGIDLSKLTHIVISHGHNDHTRGLKFLDNAIDMSRITLIAHPDCFLPKYFDGGYIGSPFDEDKIRDKTIYKPSKEPDYIAEDLIFLGEIPSVLEFEERYAIGKRINNGVEEDDFIKEDSALVYKTEEGIFIITGCSHCGICNIIEYAKSICKDNRIVGIIGGFHLFDAGERLEKTVEYFEDSKIKNLYPCHCVSLRAKARMLERLNIREVGVGLEIEL